MHANKRSKISMDTRTRTCRANTDRSSTSRRRPLLSSLALATILLSGAATAANGEEKSDEFSKQNDNDGRRLRVGKNDERKETKQEDRGDSNLPLLDFAVIGFPKTGTSFMEHYLFNTEETFIDNQENCFTGGHHGQDFIDKLVNERHYEIGKKTRDGHRIKNAVKCPKELLGPKALANYERNFPEIKFIISTRHPVWWFQSRYNYKLRQSYKHSNGKKIWAPPPSDLLGPCADGAYHYGMSGPFDRIAKEREDPTFQPREPSAVCTDGSKFHHGLSRLGKTSLETQDERNLLGRHEMSVHSFPKAKVFLMEIGQFSIEDPLLANQLLQDMKEFLGLENDLPPLVEHESKKLVDEVQEHAMNICDDEHSLLRAELVKNGAEASRWIREYFLDSPDVVVSSRDHFLELIQKWQYDPCIAEAQNML